MRRLLSILLILLIAAPAAAQTKADTVGASATLGSLNAAASVALAGEQGAEVFVASGTLAGTLVPEVSVDGGTTWVAAVFLDSVTGTISTSQVLTNPSPALALTIGHLGAITHARVRVSSYTSGSTTARLRATMARPYVVIYGTDGTTIRGLAVTSTGAAKIDGSAVTQPVSASSLPLPSGAATEGTLSGVKSGTDRIPSSPATDRTTAGAPFACRLSDGSSFFKPTTPSDTQPVSGTLTCNAGSGTFTDQHTNVTADYDTGGGTQTMTMYGLALPKSGGAVAGGTATDPVRVDPTGSTVQPVKGAGAVVAESIAVRCVDAAGVGFESCAGAGGSGGTASADGATYTAGSTSGTPMMGARDDTSPGTVAEDKLGIVRITANRAAHANLRDASGNEIGTAGAPVRVDPTGTTTQPVDSELPAAAALADGASNPTTPTVGAAGLVYNGSTWDRRRATTNGMDSTGTGITAAGMVGQLDDTSTSSVTENQFAVVRITGARGAHANLRDASGNEIASKTTTAASGDRGLVVRPLAATDGTNTMPTMDAAPRAGNQKITDGTNTAAVKAASTPAATTDPALVVQQAPLASPICTSFVAISQTGSTKLVSGSASKRVYICSLVLVAGAAEIISLSEGTGTTCATGAAAIMGSTTTANGMSFAANGGVSMIAGTPFLKTATDADDVCLLQNGSNRVSGFMTYVVQ